MSIESNQEKVPVIAVPDLAGGCASGWDSIAAELRRSIAKCRAEKPILVVECYPGVDELAALNEFASRLAPKLTIHASEAYHARNRADELIAPFTERKVPSSGAFPRLSLVNFFDAEPLWRLRRTIDELKDGLVLIVGGGASLIAWGHILVYADLARREARQRFRRNDKSNRAVDDKSVRANLADKGAFLIDWGVADRWKRPLIKRWDYLLDTSNPHEPKLVEGEDVRRALHIAARQPFQFVPLSDSCLLEENSLALGFGDLRIEIPAIDLVFNQPQAFLGEAVHVRFGYEFPIRFDFLDNIHCFEPLEQDYGWSVERAGLAVRAGIEMRRQRFSKSLPHDTRGSVNVLKLAEGDEAIFESPGGGFEPVVVRHAETFIVPAAVGRYIIRPHGPSAGREIATITAFVST